ncbi:hypothetical protein G6F37_003151 [Rhizopus arrhizus]|nr:hypothetical protein G6F38_006168 [Rhizopus arrhizus]KAG1161361.1 hypothetical protein G6F37_003151 [Rhizopus arrhizus]
MKPKDAAKAENVNYNTARKWKQAYNNDPEKNIPLKKTNRTSNRPVSQLNGAHKEHLIKFFDEDASATIQDATEDLIKSFAGLELKKSRVAESMKEECNLSLKVVRRHAIARNCKKKLLKPAQLGSKIAEAGQQKAWLQSLRPLLLNPIRRLLFEAISAFDVVNLTMRESGNIKRRKVVGATKRKTPEDRVSIPKRTTSGHYVQFINGTIDIIMNNAPIHVPWVIGPVIIRRGYIPIYLPLYSPELNPIEHFWAALKSKVKRTKFSDIETLSSRIIESSEAIPVEHLQHFIQHSVNPFGDCLNKNSI